MDREFTARRREFSRTRGLRLDDAPSYGPRAAAYALSPFNFAPQDTFFFDDVAFANLPAVGVANRTTVVKRQIPGGSNGVVHWLGNAYYGGGFVDGSGQVVWRIFLDDKPVQNYENIQASLGSLAVPTDTFIVLQEGQTVRWTVETTVAQPAGTTTGCRLKGWYWSTAGQTLAGA